MDYELVRVGRLEEVQQAGRTVVSTPRAPILVLWHDGRFAAIDNRCPHMGFPLHQGDVHDGLLDCHWHHARYDITCGRTLDPWADDADAFEVVVKDGEVFVDPNLPVRDALAHGSERLARGLEDNLRLVIAKAVVEHVEGGVDVVHSIRAGAAFGARERAAGFDVGLSILAATANVLPALREQDRSRGLVHALSRIARDCSGSPPRRPLAPLDGTKRDREGLRSWFRETVEVRDADGSERILAAVVREHGTRAALDTVLAACTDHRYADVGHTLDFAVKCAELSEHCDDAATTELLFTSLVPQLVQMRRMEETSAWRRPVDVADLVARAAEGLPDAPFEAPPATEIPPLEDEQALVEELLGEDPAAVSSNLLARLKEGAPPAALADAVVTAATMRILTFGKANELSDWDTAHHTLTYANAVAEGIRRAPSKELFRGVLDAAMSVYLDRFLSIPPAPLPHSDQATGKNEAALEQLTALYDGRGPVDEAAHQSWSYLQAGGTPEQLFKTLGHIALREDTGFHEHQQLELAWRRMQRRGNHRTTHLLLAAVARWIASQYPTRRAAEQTFRIAKRLHRGDALFEG